MCREYQLHPRADPLFYVTDVVLPPLIFGVGVGGNLLLLLVLNRRFLRRDSAVYVYLSAIAGVDLLALFCAVPLFVRDLDLFPLDVTFSWQMAYAVWVRRAVEPILRHSAAWFTLMVVAVRYAGSRLPDSPAAGWTRISASRVVAFVLFIACVLLDFTRFLDTSVVQLQHHCFSQMSLWSQNVTRLGLDRFYSEIQPTASVIAGSLLPVALTLGFALLLLGGHLGCCGRLRRTRVALQLPSNRDEHEYQLSVTVFAISMALVCLESLRVAVDVAEVFFFRYEVPVGVGGSVVYYLRLIAKCLSLCRCAVNFVLLALLCYDFRKTLRRTFCCCCSTSDDVFYEPVTCCRCRRGGEAKISLDELEDASSSTRGDLYQPYNGTRSSDGVYDTVSRNGQPGTMLYDETDLDDDRALWI